MAQHCNVVEDFLAGPEVW